MVRRGELMKLRIGVGLIAMVLGGCGQTKTASMDTPGDSPDARQFDAAVDEFGVADAHLDAQHDGAVPEVAYVCPGRLKEGDSCTTLGARCPLEKCVACSDSLWRFSSAIPCYCTGEGNWTCPGAEVADVVAGHNCFPDTPLTCDIAQDLFTDDACTVHPSYADGGTVRSEP